MFKKLILLSILISSFYQISSQDLRAEYTKCLIEDIEYQDCLIEYQRCFLEAHWNSLNELSNSKKDIDKMKAGFKVCKDRLKTRLCPIIKDIFER